eukprot:c20345_g1_i5 orf=2-322(-)
MTVFTTSMDASLVAPASVLPFLTGKEVRSFGRRGVRAWGEAEAGALKGMKGCADRRGAAAATEIPYVLQAAASQPPKHHHRRLLHNPAHRSVVFTQARMPSFLFLFR